MIKKRINADFKGESLAWKQHLIKSMPERNFDQDNKWMNASSPRDMAIKWATESNGFDCSAVFPKYLESPETDLGGEYYETAIPEVERMVAVAGYRLGVLLNYLLGEEKRVNKRLPIPINRGHRKRIRLH